MLVVVHYVCADTLAPLLTLLITDPFPYYG